MVHSLYAFLAQPWSGFAIALLFAALAAAAYRKSKIAGSVLGLLAILLMVGALVGWIRARDAAGRYPARGKLVDVGGYRMHLLAEGDAKGAPPLVWLSGGHSSGLALFHLHKAFRGETRSILVDRPGTGMSDPGPFPRTTQREAFEMETALRTMGERGPFVLIGHSYGGLLAANFARRFPAQTAAVILLDPTPPDVFTYLPGGGGPALPAGIARAGELQALLKRFGLWSLPAYVEPSGDSEMARVVRAYRKQLADVQNELDAAAASAAGDLATASLFREWESPRSVSELLVYDGELGDLPVFVVCPADNDPKSTEAQLGLSGDELRRATGFLQRTRMRYLQASSKSEWIQAPKGTGHNFPYEAPEFTVEAIRGAISKIRKPD